MFIFVMTLYNYNNTTILTVKMYAKLCLPLLICYFQIYSQTINGRWTEVFVKLMIYIQ